MYIYIYPNLVLGYGTQVHCRQRLKFQSEENLVEEMKCKPFMIDMKEFYFHIPTDYFRVFFTLEFH